VKGKGILAAMVLICAVCLANVLLCSCEKPNFAESKVAVTEVAEIEINAPVDMVFNYMADPANVTDYDHNVTSVTDVRGQGAGTIFNWTAELNGQSFQGQSIFTDYEPNKRIVMKSTFPDYWTLLFQTTENGGTRIVFLLEIFLNPPAQGEEDLGKNVRAGMQIMLELIKEEVEKMPAEDSSGEKPGAEVENITIADTFMASVEIKAPVEDVFRYMNEHCEQWHFSKISNLRGEGLGRSADWSLELEGVSASGQVLVVDYEPNRRVVEFVRGNVNGQGTWFNLEHYLWLPIEGGTRVMFNGSYILNAPEISEAVGDLLKRENHEAGMNQILQKFKAELEK
jgi:uncharacterized protein YndB with AHSA1/START domain